MFRLSAFIIVLLIWLSVPAAGGGQAPGFKPYLGLALPYPKDIFEWTVEFPQDQKVRDGLYAARLMVDEKGKVQEVTYPEDSALYLEPLEKKKKDISFLFLDGRRLKFPLIVPVLVEYFGLPLNKKTARIRFPVSADTLSDTTLLAEFFVFNEITPPAVKAMLPVFYYFDREREEPQCLTITALVFLDEQGRLTALEYPFEGQDRMTHQIQCSLIRAEFEPARIGKESLASEFFLTFRVFDNMHFPYSSFLPADSTRDRLFTENYFMIRYLNPRDISIGALPRRYGSGKLPMPREFRHLREKMNVRLAITPNGKARVLSSAISPGRNTVPKEIVRLTNWYPAVNNKGQRENFIGIVKVKLDGGAYIVCIPEWLK